MCTRLCREGSFHNGQCSTLYRRHTPHIYPLLRKLAFVTTANFNAKVIYLASLFKKRAVNRSSIDNGYQGSEDSQGEELHFVWTVVG